jgi:hypothetical protein
VRGTISHHGTLFYLTSLGDNTVFELIGIPVPQTRDSTVINKSLYTRQLDQGQAQQLLEIERASQTATVEGPLFEPWRSPALRIALQNIQVDNPGGQQNMPPSNSVFFTSPQP